MIVCYCSMNKWADLNLLTKRKVFKCRIHNTRCIRIHWSIIGTKKLTRHWTSLFIRWLCTFSALFHNPCISDTFKLMFTFGRIVLIFRRGVGIGYFELHQSMSMSGLWAWWGSVSIKWREFLFHSCIFSSRDIEHHCQCHTIYDFKNGIELENVQWTTVDVLTLCWVQLYCSSWVW